MKIKKCIYLLSLFLLTGCDSVKTNLSSIVETVSHTYSGATEIVINRKYNFSFTGFSKNAIYESSDDSIFKIIDNQILGVNKGKAFLVAKEENNETKIEINVREPSISDEILIPEYSYSFNEIVKTDNEQVASVEGKVYKEGYCVSFLSEEENFDSECYYYGDVVLNVTNENGEYKASTDDINEYVNKINPFFIQCAFDYKYQLSKCDVKFESSTIEGDSFIDVYTTNDYMINFIGVDFAECYNNKFIFKDGILTKLELRTSEENEEDSTEIEINFSDIDKIEIDHEVKVESSENDYNFDF